MAQLHRNIIHGLAYLKKVLTARLDAYFKVEKQGEEIELAALSLEDHKDPLSQFIQFYKLSTEESIVLLMALAPHLLPNFYDGIIGRYLPDGGQFPAFGGVKSSNQRHTLPTGETVMFVLAGNDIQKRLALQFVFDPQHFFTKENILYLETNKKGEPLLASRLLLDAEYVEWFTNGQLSIPKMTTSFPAQYISTQMDWEDLVLNASTKQQIKELEHWVQYNQTLMQDWGMAKKLKPGYKVLFYGPPGTGKTLTASLLGKYTNKPVFKIDLSMVISKYIGETEKNLSNLFDRAQNKDWILFFDEADAIFGKRTNVRDAHDKYANQEVSYLLQRIEQFTGLTILASNFKSNIDEAFLRRFSALIHFPLPKAAERLILWQKAFPQQIEFAPDVNLQQIAQKYELSGAHIMNIVQHTCLGALADQSELITGKSLLNSIRREFQKEGKSV